MEIVNISLRF